MKYAIDILTAKRKEIVNELKKQDTDRNRNLENLKSIDKALKWLDMLEKNNVENFCVCLTRKTVSHLTESCVTMKRNPFRIYMMKILNFFQMI